MPRFYILNRPPHLWGDYGEMLTHGMAYRGDGGNLEIKRTGPFVPPITDPGIGEVVVTQNFRNALERSGLNGLIFEPVVKRLIVRLDWPNWDQLADEPAEYPESGEPEDYVLGQPHSPDAADEMGPLWAMTLNHDAKTRREQPIVWHRRHIKLVTNSWQGQDIFGAQDVGFVYVTDQAKLWFEKHVPDQLRFEDASTVDA